MLLTCSSVIAAKSNYAVDTNKSLLHWTGRKPTGSHSGTLAIKAGHFTFENCQLEELELLFDMESISITDRMSPAWKTKLQKHLLSDDFFSVAKFPLASYKLTHVQGDERAGFQTTGNLLLKAISRPVSALVQLTGPCSNPNLATQLKIDRTQWSIQYMSKEEFDPKTLIDTFIYRDIDIEGILVPAAKTRH
jgi:polyisoprenoid-binding protein YceI